MKRLSCFLIALFALWLVSTPPASAQTVNLWCWTGPIAPEWQPCSTSNPLAVNASVSASITGFPGSTQTTGTPISVTSSAGGVTGTLPAGTVVVASNVGTTNNAYCKLGASATTSDQLIAPNSWFGFTVGTNTQLTCITSTSTTTVNMVGGAGLPTGAGGGSGSGSNASVGATGSAVPASATYIAGISGGNLTGATIGTYGTAPGAVNALNVNASVTNTNANGQATAANSSPVVLASNQTAADPCMFQLKSHAPINLTASGQVITGTAAKKTYICGLDLISGTAQNIALVEGTGTTCATNIFGLAGGTTAATGWNLAANGGLTKGNGEGIVYYGSGDANATAANVCLLLSSTGQTSGSIQYVQQ